MCMYVKKNRCSHMMVDEDLCLGWDLFASLLIWHWQQRRLRQIAQIHRSAVTVNPLAAISLQENTCTHANLPAWALFLSESCHFVPFLLPLCAAPAATLSPLQPISKYISATGRRVFFFVFFSEWRGCGQARAAGEPEPKEQKSDLVR